MIKYFCPITLIVTFFLLLTNYVTAQNDSVMIKLHMTNLPKLADETYWVKFASKVIIYADSLASSGEEVEAIKFCKSALYYSNHPSIKVKISDLYLNLAQIKLTQHDNGFDTLYQKAMEYAKLSEDKTQILQSYWMISRMYYTLNKPYKSIIYSDTCVDYIEKNEPELDPEYIGWTYYNRGVFFNRLHMQYQTIVNFKKAIPYFTKSGDYPMAIKSCARAADDLLENGFSSAEVNYYQNLFCNKLEQKAIENGDNMIDIKFNSLQYLAQIQLVNRQYDEGLKTCKLFESYVDSFYMRKEKEIKGFVVGKEINLRLWYDKIEIPFLDGLKLYDEIKEKAEYYYSQDTIAERPDRIGDYFKEVADFYYNHIQYENALRFYQKSYQYYNDPKRYSPTESFYCLVQIGKCCFGLGKLEDAEKNHLKAKDLMQLAHPYENFDYINLYEYIALTKSDLGKNDSVDYYIDKAIELAKRLTTENYAYYTLGNQVTFFNNINISSDRILAFLSTINNPSEKLLINAFNINMLKKNVDFISNLSFRENIQANDSILKIYNQLVILKHLYANQSLRNEDRDSIYLVSKKIENKLKSKNYVMSHFHEKISVDFFDIRNSLKDKELAVEIVKIFNYDQEYSNQRPFLCDYPYFAFVFDNRCSAPKLIRLFSEAELQDIKAINPNILYTDTNFKKIIWDKILNDFPETETIYFSPVAGVNSIAPEYLAVNKSSCMSDVYNIYRLSSITNILDQNEEKIGNNMLMVSDVDYYLPPELMIQQAKKMSNPNTEKYCYRTNYLEEFKPLKATREEGDYINYINWNKKITHLTKENSTEEAFKRYSVEHQNIIHIATHGFMNPARNIQNQASSELLKNAGLILAGANNLYLGYNIPEDVEDGYLTAQEISELALNHTQLVVLSACNTGLGQVGDNGVYGLERAFKLAGAKTIIMTLGAVDDSATSLFMRRFYKYLFDGNSPREALHKTQSFLRDGNQYNEPFYWAAFVIVD